MPAQFLIIQLCVCYCKERNERKELKQSSEVEVRSVFLNCDLEDTTFSPDSELIRFQRGEIFKHNTLRNCKRKLAVTIKMCNEVSETTADEFIPIEHVLGANNKRIRLLNPYILRLRREPTAQLYKIRKLDIVTGVFSTTDPLKENRKEFKRNHSPYNTIADEVLENNTEEKYRVIEPDFKDYNSLYYITTKNEPSDEFFDRSDFESNGKVQLGKYKPMLPKRKYIKSKSNEKNGMSRLVANVDDDFGLFNQHHHHFMNDKNSGMNRKKRHNIDNVTITTDTPKSNDYILYEIGNPDLWYKARVQVYEKITTPEGKTMWNDMTKFETASVSTIDPLWKSQDLSIRYRTKDFVKREDFDLPSGSLCLVLPLNYARENIFPHDVNLNTNGKFIIVPINDVIVIKSKNEGPKDDSDDFSNNGRKQRHVVIKTARTLMIGNMADLNIMEQGEESFLKLPHKSAHRSQIDIEAKADENKLIIPGVVPRECSPPLSDVYEGASTDISTHKTLIPPMHTKVFILDLPLEIAHDNYLCSIALLNGDGEAVATRDVTIKKNDRCFCVWRCDCVCLGDDPKLMCRDMEEAELLAAGLSLHEGTRRARSACYPDVVTINMFVIFIGVFIILFIFGVIKAFLGIVLPCVGLWGLELLLNVPRKLDHYYESSLKGRPVVYDKEGWPVHPDTKKRTVLLVSKPMEFILNVIMFVTLPCILLWDAVMQIVSKCQNADENVVEKYQNTTKKCFSSHDMQSGEPRWRRNRGEMHKWMTPQAEALSADIWHYGLSSSGTKDCNCMQPLLYENANIGAKEKQLTYVDSEQNDTAYVLMQMQKSKESLALKNS